VVRFAGDSGDGIQLVGARFTETSALAGNDFFTFPDFPAEIRAPAGSLAGVSAFQIQLSDERAWTPGDIADVLVAMNPAALKTNLAWLRDHGTLVLNSSGFSDKTLKQAGYASDPREDGSLEAYTVLQVEAGALTERALEGLELSRSNVLKHKNFFMLGLVNWLFGCDPQVTLDWIERRFRQKLPVVAEGNVRALRAGHAYAETLELVTPTHMQATRARPAGHYRRISGNEALGFGLLAAAERSGLELVLSSYPITPASDILHFLSAQASLGVRTLQTEDEIAAIGATIGAAYAGALAVTTTSGPGLDLKSEALGLAVSLELPLLVIDVQRAGPSTGMPTKAEQSDLLQACYGRHGEAPLPVLATSTPGDCFWSVLEAARIAIRYMTPVILLSDAYVANGTEPWAIPQLDAIPPIPVAFAEPSDDFAPYRRNADGARPWALPGTPGLEHRIGGLAKDELMGNVSYEPEQHARMCRLRADKIAGIAASYPPSEVFGDQDGELLVIGWGGTFGAIRQAVGQAREAGAQRIGHLHLRHLNPLPRDLGALLKRYRKVLVPELNSGHLTRLLRAEFLVDAQCLSKLQGQPFRVAELRAAIDQHLEAA
jgi:2-oxoglutarate ferredoxin oxidoreductase subunit alpha